MPSRCADLLHEREIDVGLIPSIEYLRGPARQRYRIVPNVAIASRGPVASVALYTRRPVSAWDGRRFDEAAGDFRALGSLQLSSCFPPLP